MSVINRIPSLDGLRAISILLVLVSHSFGSIKTYLDLGNLGVRMFFIISSYLIAGILYRDVVKNRFSLKTFYFKRLMRTFPAFYFYLAILAVVLVLTGHFEWSQFWRAPVYLENYHPRELWNRNQWFVGHTWSLAVEEQFYLVIAILFAFFNRGKINFKKLTIILVSVVVLIPIIRISYMTFSAIPEVLRGSIHRSFETVADALATGALLALFKERILNSAYLPKCKPFIIPLIGVILLVQFFNSSVAVSTFGYASRYLFNSVGIFIVNVALALIMIYAIQTSKESILYKVLNFKPLVSIGLLSYSIYLWQQLWLFDWEIPLLVKWLGIATCSLISYYLVEEKFLVLRDRMLSRKINKV